MEITIKKNVEINSVEQWFIVAPPKGKEKQWKNGRSAKELARFATDPSFKEFISSILKQEGLREQDFVCEPEAETELKSAIDMGISGPRNHDLLMIGSKDCVIGLEAKVSESFGNNTIGEEWIKADTKNKKEKRIPGLVQFITNNTYTNFSGVPDRIKSLMYQLFTATVGTIIEAKKRGKKNALVLVLVFTGNVDKESGYNDKMKQNQSDFEAFVQEFFPNGEAIIQNVRCRLRKVEVEITSPYQF